MPAVVFCLRAFWSFGVACECATLPFVETHPQATGEAKPRTALVLSAGAMFGAYQAGVWQALEGRVQPDVVVGASVGSLNGWAIAGGMPAAMLAERWLSLEAAGRIRFRWPRRLLDGWVEAGYLQLWIQELHSRLQPQCEFALVMTRVWPLRPELVKAPEVTWQHLADSCAMPFLFPHYRLQGALYTDGGLMQALPLWAARQFECQRVIAVNVLPTFPLPGRQLASSVMRGLSRHSFEEPNGHVLRIQPLHPLGGVSDFMVWSRHRAQRWLQQGRDDAERAIASPFWCV
ncbi:MAG: patatin-like phospholipase family protein [Bryobacterales bacterium]|nr:patatin-like phospholipase family protein [Bryobacterales bacterium]